MYIIRPFIPTYHIHSDLTVRFGVCWNNLPTYHFEVLRISTNSPFWVLSALKNETDQIITRELTYNSS